MPKSLQGHFLIASPELMDPNFFHSVILIVQHDQDGAVGLVLNRPTKMSISDAWKQVSEMPYDSDALVYQGGPCEGPLMVLHTNDEALQIEVFPGVYYNSDAGGITALVEQKVEPIRFFVGYAGWQGQQLEEELAESAWLVVQGNADLVFNTSEELWTVLSKAGMRRTVTHNIHPKLIPPDPSMN